MAKSDLSVLSYDAFTALMCGNLCGAFLFYGEEDYLKGRVMSDLRSSVLTAEGFEIFNHFDISFSASSSLPRESIFASLSDACDASPLMQDRKLIEVHDIIPDKIPQTELDSIVSIAKKVGTDAVFILYCRSNELICDYKLEQSALFRKLADVMRPVRFDLVPTGKLISFIRRQLKAQNVFIEDDAAQTLVDMCASRLLAITSEVSKLISYASVNKNGETYMITDDIVRSVCSESASDELPFALSEAMMRWNLTAVMNALDLSRETKEEPIAVCAKISRVLTDMLTVKAGISSGVTVDDISKAMKMKPFRTGKYVDAVKNVPIEIIERAVSTMYRLDRDLKSTQTDAWVLIDGAVTDIYLPRSLR